MYDRKPLEKGKTSIVRKQSRWRVKRINEGSGVVLLRLRGSLDFARDDDNGRVLSRQDVNKVLPYDD